MPFANPVWIGRTDANTNSAASNTLTVSLPAGTQEGDLLVALVHTQGGTVSSSGFVERSNLARTSGNNVTILTKWVGASEPNPTFSFTSSSTLQYAILTTYRGVGSVGMSNQVGYGASVTNLTLPVVTAVYPNSTVFNQIFMLRTTTGSVTWPSHTVERSDTVSNSGGAWWLLTSADQPLNDLGASTPSTIAVQSSSSGSGSNGVGSSLVLNPVAPHPAFRGVSEATTATTGASSLTVTYPNDSIPGDLLVMSVAANRQSAAASISAVPTDWILVPNTYVDQSANFTSGAVFYRYRGSETSVTVPTSGTTVTNAIIHAYVPGNIDPSAPIGSAVGSIDLTASQTVLNPTLNNTSSNGAVSFFAHTRRASSTTTYTNTWSGATKFSDTGQASSTGTAISRTSAIRYDDSPSNITNVTITPSAAVNRSYTAIVVVQPVQNLTIIDSDSASALDDATVNAVLTDGDTSTSVESNSIAVTDSEVASAAIDNATVSAASDAQDAATATDNAFVTAVVTDQDVGTSVEDQMVTNTVIDTDTATGTDNSANIALQDISNESSAAADSAQVDASTPVNETGTAADNDATIINTVDTEIVGGVEMQVVIVTVSDSGVAVDDAPIPNASVVAQDTATGAENQVIAVTAAKDEGEGSDNAVRSVEGVLVAPRVYTIYPVSRWYDVPAEDRTRTIARSYREYVIASEGFTNNN